MQTECERCSCCGNDFCCIENGKPNPEKCELNQMVDGFTQALETKSEVIMKIKVWVHTTIAGSKTEDEIELPDDLTEEQINEEVYDYIMNFVEWGWERI